MKNNKHSSLGELLLILRRNIGEKFRKEGLKDELTFSQAEVLRFIGPNGKETMKNIAEFLKITPPSATEIIADMEKKGFIKRKSDAKDRRIVYIVLSDMAKKLFMSLCKHKENIFKKMTARLNKQDKASLERIIRILITE